MILLKLKNFYVNIIMPRKPRPPSAKYKKRTVIRNVKTDEATKQTKMISYMGSYENISGKEKIREEQIVSDGKKTHVYKNIDGKKENYVFEGSPKKLIKPRPPKTPKKKSLERPKTRERLGGLNEFEHIETDVDFDLINDIFRNNIKLPPVDLKQGIYRRLRH